MAGSTGVHIHVMPIKAVYDRITEEDRRQTAGLILCTTYPLRRECLLGVSCLHLDFADTEDGKRENAFTPAMAVKVRNFVKSFESWGTELYICCDSGESRSTAIAAAVRRFWKQDEKAIWKNPRYHPNLLVYELQRRAFGCPVGRCGLKYRAWLNKRALRQAIRRARKEESRKKE